MILDGLERVAQPFGGDPGLVHGARRARNAARDALESRIELDRQTRDGRRNERGERCFLATRRFIPERDQATPQLVLEPGE